VGVNEYCSGTGAEEYNLELRGRKYRSLGKMNQSYGLYDTFAATNAVGMIRWAAHVARIIEICIRVLVGKPEGSILLEDQDGGEMIILKRIVNKMR
jgi:hypothetical protein